MAGGQQDTGAWLAIWELSELEMGFRARKIDKRALRVSGDKSRPDLGHTKADRLEQRGTTRGEERAGSQERTCFKEGGIHAPNDAIGSSRMWTERARLLYLR